MNMSGFERLAAAVAAVEAVKSATVTIIMDRVFVVGPTADHFAFRGVSDAEFEFQAKCDVENERKMRVWGK